MNPCSLCNRNFNVAELLQSKDDQYFCKDCFKYEYCSGRQLSNKKKSKLPNTCEGDSLLKTNKMFPLAELLAMKNGRNKNILFTSKRPLQCPHVDCNRYVSVYDLIAHFQHEHMEVRITQTVLDARNPLEFCPGDVRYGVKQCLILLNVLPPVEDSNNKNVSQSEKPPIPVTVAVLASRIAAAQLAEDEDDSLLDEQNEVLVDKSDKIIIWTASNVVCKYSYTVAVSTVLEDVRVKYYGPVLQLGSGPKEMCLGGECLVLSHFYFLGMSDNGTKPLHLDVIIHSED